MSPVCQAACNNNEVVENGGCTCTGTGGGGGGTCTGLGGGCSSSAQCCSPYACVGGTCQQPVGCVPSGGVCANDGDCCSGLSCNNGTCGVPPGDGGTCTPEGGGCSQSTDCCGGCCNTSTQNGVCDTSACGGEGGCQFYRCVNGACSLYKGNNDCIKWPGTCCGTDSCDPGNPNACTASLNASCVFTKTLPSTVIPGQPVSLSMTYTNTGSSAWTWPGPPYPYFVAGAPDAQYLDEGWQHIVPSPINPGGQFKLTMNFNAPTQTGTYHWGYQMLAANADLSGTWFGSICKQDFSVVLGYPALISPANNASVPPGNTTFQYALAA